MNENMFSEQRYNPVIEKVLQITVKRSVDAPPDVKQNPFFDPELWGRATSPDDIYLPDCDEALSFAVAAHEIGHLVEEGERNDARLDNFEATRAEEKRAWDKCWEYVRKYIDEYYQDNPKNIPKILLAFEHVKTLLMQATDLSRDMYLESGQLDRLTPNEIKQILKERRENFFSQKGEVFKQIFDEVKKEKIGIKPDWHKFILIIQKAVRDILRDNKKFNMQKNDD
jgi:hypothetical protein